MVTLLLAPFLVFLAVTLFCLPAMMRLARQSESHDRIAEVLANQIARQVRP
jgi:hypothetical protein